jgi:Xaa-Pro aminopeptidase
MNYGSRRERLLAALDAGIDALLVSHPINVRYLTGFTGDSSYLIAGRTRTLLVSDGRFSEQLAGECPGLETHIRGLAETTLEALAAVVEKLGMRRLAFESHRLTVADFEAVKHKLTTAELQPTRDIVERLRAVKDDDEVAAIRRAIAAAEGAFEAFRGQLQPGDREVELADRMEFLVRGHGARRTSFEPITAGGERSALAHAPPTDRVLTTGGWLLVDWGAVVDGYCSDLTRLLVPNTQLFRQSNSPAIDLTRLAAAYRAVDVAREQAIAAIRPGVATKAVDDVARTALAAAGLAEQFTHSLGHGIGLEVHEKPGLRMNSDDVLAAGMVVTVEPGVYFPGWGGIRIEDDVLVTPGGAETLSSLPRDFEAALV